MHTHLSAVGIKSKIETLQHFALLLSTQVAQHRFKPAPQKFVCDLLSGYVLVALQPAQVCEGLGSKDVSCALAWIQKISIIVNLRGLLVSGPLKSAPSSLQAVKKCWLGYCSCQSAQIPAGHAYIYIRKDYPESTAALCQPRSTCYSISRGKNPIHSQKDTSPATRECHELWHPPEALS